MEESNIPEIIDIVFDCLQLLSKDDNNDEIYYKLNNIYNINEIKLNFYSLIGSKLIYPDRMITNNHSYKYIIIIKDVYYTIYISDYFAEFCFKRFALLDEAFDYFNCL